MMFSSLKIEGYRGFDRFEMSGLGRINLLVGTNNSGKTSVLEAVSLLASGGDPVALLQSLWRRGERLAQEFSPAGDRGVVRRYVPEWDVAHLFQGHDLLPGSTIRVSSGLESGGRYVELVVVEGSGEQFTDLFEPDAETSAPQAPHVRNAIEVRGLPRPAQERIPLSRSGAVILDEFARRTRSRGSEANPVQFIAAESLTGDELAAMWSKVVLTESEELVLRAIRSLDPDIERIAAQNVFQPSSSRSRGGFLVRLRGLERPVPIGSMGDGMWRMLALAIAVTQCRGGVLLVDEIDSGLHYSVMSKMWTLIYDAARDLDVQVFATTHSYDCVYSLAAICTDRDRGAVTIQRIEKGKAGSVPYDEDEITAAADHNIEVR